MSARTPDKPVQSRRSKYVRPTKPTAIRLTDDDLQILRQVAKHRFLDRTHIERLMPHRSPKKLVERLGLLWENGYLDRPIAQKDYYHTAGSRPMVYAIGNKGIRALAERDGTDPGRIDWTWKNRASGRDFLNHTLLTSELMVSAERATHADPEVLLIERDSILAKAPEETRRAKTPLKFTVRCHHDGKAIDLSVIPDQLFGYDFTRERLRKYFFVEADMATMPIVRSNLKTSSIYRKWKAYIEGGGKRNSFGKRLGIGNFRVLTVTTSQARIANMIDAITSLTPDRQGWRQFLFTDKDTLTAAPDLISLAWLNSKGETVRLTD